MAADQRELVLPETAQARRLACNLQAQREASQRGHWGPPPKDPRLAVHAELEEKQTLACP